jgi:hypothetical protein
MNIITKTAHADDEILGLGSSWILTQQGPKVHYFISSGYVDVRRHRLDTEEFANDIKKANETVGSIFELANFPHIGFNVLPGIDLVQSIEKVIEEFQPDWAFTDHPMDLNDDHKHVPNACQASVRLFLSKPIKRIKAFYCMEISSSTDWSLPIGDGGFAPKTYIELGEDGLNRKLESLSMYSGVMRNFPHPRSVEAIKGFAAKRGGESGYNYAEAFQLVFQGLE